ncbi:MAG: S-layer homology domain-containing protein, partial [Thiotrichaceae bacterium]|nr:S-layer homology domain-containing protein [Thiotrichaceae bacterium]
MTVLNLCAHYVGRFKRGYGWTIHLSIFFYLFLALNLTNNVIAQEHNGYYAPYKAGTSIKVSQASNGTVSHYGKGYAYAIDFAGTFDIYAAKDGTVDVVGTDSYKPEHCKNNPSHWHGAANYIRIKHDDGLYTYYYHFASINVSEGKRVTRGQTKLGISGNTGCSTAPHLHFQLANAASMGRANSINVVFEDIGKPVVSTFYTSQNKPESIKLAQFDQAPHFLAQGDSANLKFTLENTGSSLATVEDITLAVIDSSDNNKGDLMYAGEHSFTANQLASFDTEITSVLTNNLKVGEYSLIPKIKQSGLWRHLDSHTFEIWTEDMAAYTGQGIIRSDSEMFKDERRNTFIAILMRALEKRTGRTLTEATTSQFTDVPVDGLRTEILKAEQLGIISGGSSGLFYPTRTISRIEALAFTVRAFEALAREIMPQCKLAFADFPSEDNKQWMHEIMQKGYSQYLTSGYGSGDARVFKPEDTVNRLEAVAFVENVIKQLINPSASREEIATTCWDEVEQNTSENDTNDTGVCWRSADPQEKYKIYDNNDNPVTTAEIMGGKASHDLSPAEIIYYSAKENTLNPVLLLAKLQQEQSLLTQGKDWSNAAGNFEERLYRAMGVGTYDSGETTKWYGFYPQIVSAAYEWYLSRERDKKSLQDGLKEYTSNPDAYQQLLDFYADYAGKMNTITGTSFETYPDISSTGGYYNDFRNITADNIQTFLELSAFGSGALSNVNLFREPPIEDNSINYCDSNTTNIDDTSTEEPPTTLSCQNGGLILPFIDDNLNDDIVWKRIGNPFGNYLSGLGGFHPGDDWNLRYIDKDSPWPNDLGEPVYSIADGTVEKISNLGGLGMLVAIKHTGKFLIPSDSGSSNGQSYSYPKQTVDGLISFYVHINTLNPEITQALTTNAAIPQGTRIGNIMNAGTGPHLHFEIRLPNTMHSNNWSLAGSSSNWASDKNGYTGYYINLQKMIDAGFRNPLSVVEANECAPIIVKTNDKAKGDVSILSNLINSSDNYTVKLDGQVVSITSIVNGNLRFNTGLDPLSYIVTKPLSVMDAQGNTIIDTYYPFTDVEPDAWFAKAAIQLWKLDIMNGIDGQFLQGKEIKRSEFIKISVLAKQLAGLLDAAKTFPEQGTDFVDVISEHWASGYIQYAKDAQIINDGGSDKRFRPNDSLTRAEAAKVTTKSFEFSSMTSWFNQFFKQCPVNFTDLENKAWYCPYIAELYRLNIMRGS